MNWLGQHWIPLLLLALYTGVLAHHAWVGRTKTRGLADYYVGGRSMGGLAIGLSFFATYSSTNSFVGFSGQSYSYGLPWLLLTPFLVVSSLCAWLVVAPRLRDFTGSVGSLTLPDFFGFRFASQAARIFASAIVLFSGLFYTTAVFKGIANTLEAFLAIPYWVAIVAVFLIVMIYTAVGGFISVVKTDMVQGTMLIVAACLLFFFTVGHVGGPSALFAVRDLPGGEDLFSWHAAMPFPVLLGVLFAATVKFIVEPRQLSRFYALRDRTALRRGMWISTAAFLGVYSLLVPIGLYARHTYPEGITDTDHIVPALLSDPVIFPPFLSAFILVAMVAAAMSSLDSVLLVMASSCQRDIVELCRRKEATEAQALRTTRLYVGVFAALTTLLALDPPGGIVALTAFSGSIYAACFFPGLILGLYWNRGNGKALISSFTVGLLTLILWKVQPWYPSLHEVFPALFFSTLTFVGVSLTTAPQGLVQPRRVPAPAAGAGASPLRSRS